MSKFHLIIDILVLLICLIALYCSGCAGIGFEKKTTLVPNSVTFGYMQEKHKSDPHAWDVFSISAIWVFK